MESFEKPEFIENAGGAAAFIYAKVQDISGIPNPVNGFVTEITMNGNFHTGYASPGSLVFDEQAQDTDSGPLYKISVRGFYPKASAAMVQLFAEMLKQPFVVVVKDANENNIIVGNLDEPLMFAYARSTKSLVGERAGYDFEFSGLTTIPSPFLTNYPQPTIEEEPPDY